MRRLSLRTKLLIGALAWSVALFNVASLILRFHPRRQGEVHYFMLSAGSLLFLLTGVVVLQRTLSPLEALRARLAALREGRESRIGGDYPVEVQPLVDDLNALLAHREATVERALSKAGDLAHGLKTPLAVLSQEAERATRAGQTELAASIAQQVERMRRQVNYHLAQARAAASGAALGAHASVKESADGLARTLLRLHADRGLTISVDVSAAHDVRVQREDLDEMLGNLLDNACRFARAAVDIASARDGDRIVIIVDDDGPGLDESMREAVLQRGVRADEASPGSGLGLAIVRDLAELYGGSIALAAAPAGGLRATLTLPA
jgi:signal transduction histidine kinase